MPDKQQAYVRKRTWWKKSNIRVTPPPPKEEISVSRYNTRCERTTRSNEQHFRCVFWRSRVQLQAPNLSLLNEGVRGFVISLQAISRSQLRFGHDGFPPHLFEFTVDYSNTRCCWRPIALYTVRAITCISNKWDVWMRNRLTPLTGMKRYSRLWRMMIQNEQDQLF
jgi:hypothetical protein